MASRSVSDVVLTGTVEVPAVPALLAAHWQREVAQHLALAPGDVEALNLAQSRTRANSPHYRRCVQAATDWAHGIGLPDVLAESHIALMACRGAKYHHDGTQYGDSAFCNLFLSDDAGLDVHFPGAGLRIPLVRGTVVVFDTGQPHAVIRRGSSGFDVADFAADQDDALVFLTWELPIENPHVSRVLGVTFDTDPRNATTLAEPCVLLNGAAACICPESGRWCPAV